MNENNEIETSGLSKHIRPVVAILSFIVFALFSWLMVVHILQTGGDIQWVLAIMMVFAGCFLWYFNVRSHDKTIEQIAKLTGKISPKASEQPATPAASASKPQEIVNSEQTPTEVGTEPKPIPDIPLNEAMFKSAIDNDEAVAKDSDGVVNDHTRFYWAEQVLRDWLFHDVKQYKTAARIILGYARKSMAVMWWQNPTPEQIADPIAWATAHLNDDELSKALCANGTNLKTVKEKAQRLPGTGYYTTYLSVLDWEKTAE